MLLEYTIKKINNKEKIDEEKLKKLENTLTRFKKNNNN
jgi:chaperonin cofactor prefoldin